MRTQRRGPRQKKSLSQVFLRESWPCQKITDIVKSWNADRVLEIGPGKGVLTEVLLSRGLHVTCVEKDPRFVDYLEEEAKEWRDRHPGQLEIINADVLNFDMDAWLAQSQGRAAICGNIPYSISTSILMKTLPQLPKVAGLLYLVQLEFAQRLASKENTKSYGSLGVFAQLRSRVHLEFKVEKGCFIPIPKVDSAVVSLRSLTKTHPEKALHSAEIVCRRAFTQRRKMMRNSIAPFLKSIEEADIPFDLNRRPETFSPEDYLKLGELLGVGLSDDE